MHGQGAIPDKNCHYSRGDVKDEKRKGNYVCSGVENTPGEICRMTILSCRGGEFTAPSRRSRHCIIPELDFFFRRCY